MKNCAFKKSNVFHRAMRGNRAWKAVLLRIIKISNRLFGGSHLLRKLSLTFSRLLVARMASCRLYLLLLPKLTTMWHPPSRIKMLVHRVVESMRKRCVIPWEIQTEFRLVLLKIPSICQMLRRDRRCTSLRRSKLESLSLIPSRITSLPTRHPRNGLWKRIKIWIWKVLPAV
jgi:hypothetical protein